MSSPSINLQNKPNNYSGLVINQVITSNDSTKKSEAQRIWKIIKNFSKISECRDLTLSELLLYHYVTNTNSLLHYLNDIQHPLSKDIIISLFEGYNYLLSDISLINNSSKILINLCLKINQKDPVGGLFAIY